MEEVITLMHSQVEKFSASIQTFASADQYLSVVHLDTVLTGFHQLALRKASFVPEIMMKRSTLS